MGLPVGTIIESNIVPEFILNCYTYFNERNDDKFYKEFKFINENK